MSLQNNLIIAAFAALLFLIVSLPITYKITNGLFGGVLSDKKGCPTAWGLLIHTVVFGLLVFGSMYLPWQKIGVK